MDVDGLSVLGEIVRVIVATLPLPIAVVFNPNTRQRMSPAVTTLQLACLPAALAAPPVAKNVPAPAARSDEE
jgi:hypothetical protein